jgi:hypothetical protein
MPELLDRRYIWGYVQGGMMMLIGLFLVVTSPFVDEHGWGMFMYGAWYAITGFGVIRKKMYGYLMFYIAAMDSLVGFFHPGPARSHPLLSLVMLLWLGIPALGYYPARDGYSYSIGRGRRKSNSVSNSTVAAAKAVLPSRALNEAELKQVLERLREARERRRAKQSNP